MSDLSRELLAEPCGEVPDRFETADLERWSLKLAFHLLERTKNTEITALDLSVHIKDMILKRLHPAYVSFVEVQGRDRLFYKGTYCLRQPVPADVMVKAAQEARAISVS